VHIAVLMTDKINYIYSMPNGTDFLFSIRTLHIATSMYLVRLGGGATIWVAGIRLLA
jgi:hypothetical protein